MALSICRISLGHLNYRAEQIPTGDYEAAEFFPCFETVIASWKPPQAPYNRLLISFLGLTYR
jgi:hypothetical protein